MRSPLLNASLHTEQSSSVTSSIVISVSEGLSTASFDAGRAWLLSLSVADSVGALGTNA